MSRRARFIKRPEITLDATLPVPLYKQLYERLRGEILAGLLKRGARLPSTRTLASELGISRSTTVLAYTQLLLEGYLESRAGQGTLVARELPATLFHEQTVQTLRRSQGRVAVRWSALVRSRYHAVFKILLGSPGRP